MGRHKTKQIPNRLPIRLDDLIPKRDVNGGTPQKEIFGILHRFADLPEKKPHSIKHKPDIPGGDHHAI